MIAEIPTYTASELVTIIVAVFGGLVTLVGALFAGWAALKAGQAKKEVVETRAVVTETKEQVVAVHAIVEGVATSVATMNDLTMGQLADQNETRRIGEIPKDKRTDAEKDHLAVVPEKPTP